MVALITQRSLVQIQPPQPNLLSCNEFPILFEKGNAPGSGLSPKVFSSICLSCTDNLIRTNRRALPRNQSSIE
jgi:hypothetical protein